MKLWFFWLDTFKIVRTLFQLGYLVFLYRSWVFNYVVCVWISYLLNFFIVSLLVRQFWWICCFWLQKKHLMKILSPVVFCLPAIVLDTDGTAVRKSWSSPRAAFSLLEEAETGAYYLSNWQMSWRFSMGSAAQVWEVLHLAFLPLPPLLLSRKQGAV